jgi:hypothetical protein
VNIDGKLRKHKIPMPPKRLPWREWCPNQNPN